MELTTSEALYFLENVLHIEAPVNKLEADRDAFLNELIRAFLHTMPFQSLTLVSTPQEKKKVPRFDEIKASMFDRRGGLCFEMNYFMKVLLVVLGYEAYNISGDIGYPNNHVAIRVDNLNQAGDVHLVDVGAGIPIPFAVPLDFEKESPVYTSSFLTYKLVRSERETIVLMQKPDVTHPSTGEDLVDDWKTFVELKTVPVEFDRLAKNVTLVYCGPRSLPSEKFPFATSPRALDFRHGRLVAIKDTSLLLGDCQGVVDKTKLSSREEWFKAFARYFPHIPRDLLDNVLEQIDLFGINQFCANNNFKTD